MKYICPLICVSDLKRARYFYEKILKMKVKHDFDENITYEGDFAIHHAAHFQSLIEGKNINYGGNDAELYFEEDEPDALREQLIQHSISFVHDIKEQPWRQKVMRFYDPDRHIIEVGESMSHLCLRLKNEGHDNEAIANTTGLPKATVDQMLAVF